MTSAKDEPAPAHDFTASLERLLERTDAEYAIFWQLAPDGVLRFGGYHSLDGSLMEHCRGCTFRDGQDAEGRAWQTKSSVLLRDVQMLSAATFSRLRLACYHHVNSIALHCFRNGVLELGTRGTSGGASLSTLPTAAELTAELPRSPHEGLPAFHGGEQALLSCVRETGAAYALFWRCFTGLGEFKLQFWYAADGQCMRRSSTFSIAADGQGDGMVGDAWQSRKPQFVPDVQQLDLQQFPRRGLADLWGVRSIAFTPFSTGVLEYGWLEARTEASRCGIPSCARRNSRFENVAPIERSEASMPTPSLDEILSDLVVA